MASMQEIMQLCRLCLVKDQVNTPIFEEVDDISQIFLKISACLPVKVTREDKLPKRICDSCSYKLELFYDFWNTSVNSEKQLTTWLTQLGADKPSLSKVINTFTSHDVNPIILKQELPELLEVPSVDELSPSEDLNISETQDYVLQQQQLPYEGVEFEFQQEGFLDGHTSTNVLTSSATVASEITVVGPRRKRQATNKVESSDFESEDDDLDSPGSKIAKIEDEGINDATKPFINLPSTSNENDEPGPSGVGKAATDAPAGFITYGQLAVCTKIDDNTDSLYNENQENENYIDENSMDSFSLPDNDENYEEYQDIEMIEENTLRNILKPNYNTYFRLGRPKSAKKKHALCSICGKYVTLLEKHMHFYHGTYKCDTCTVAFRTEHELEAHKELHENNEYPCPECTLSFKKPVDFAYHSKEHCALKTFQCPLCQFKTPSRGSIKIHIQHHEKDYKYTCEICNRGFISNSVYTEHVDGHAGIKRFQCDICFKTFLYKRYLMVHRKLNHKKILEGYEDINECHVCQRKFSFEKSLIRHLSKIHGIGKDVSVDCAVCNKKIANPYNLKMHMRTHTGEKPYVCETCGKAFTKRVNLRRHLLNLHD